MRSKRYQRGFWQWLIPAAAGVIGSLLSKSGQESANETNLQSVREQMDFQERMRSTQYQTAVQDMQKAGLNPMLAYSQGGAGTPPGASTQVSNVGAAAVGGAVSSSQQAMQVMQAVQSMQQSEAQVDNIKAQTEKVKSETMTHDLNAAKQASEIGLLDQQTKTNFQSMLRESAAGWLVRSQAEREAIAANRDQATFQADIAKRKYESEQAKLETEKQRILKGPYDLAAKFGNSAKQQWERLQQGAREFDAGNIGSWYSKELKK